MSKAFSDMFRGLVMCLRFSMIYLEGLGLWKKKDMSRGFNDVYKAISEVQRLPKLSTK